MSRHATAKDAKWISRIYEDTWSGGCLVPWKLLSVVRDNRPEVRGVVVDAWKSAFCCYSTVKGKVYISALGCKVGHASELAMVIESAWEAAGKRKTFLHLEPAAVPPDVAQALIWTRFRGTRKALPEDLGGAATAADVEDHWYYER